MRIGEVFRLYCQTTTPPKNKYLILVAMQSYPVFLFINSDVSNFIKSRKLEHTQIRMLKENHGFLDHDSWVCTYLPCGEFSHEYFRENPHRAYGNVASDLLRAIQNAVRNSRTIRQITIRCIDEDLQRELNRRAE